MSKCFQCCSCLEVSSCLSFSFGFFESLASGRGEKEPILVWRFGGLIWRTELGNTDIYLYQTQSAEFLGVGACSMPWGIRLPGVTFAASLP